MARQESALAIQAVVNEQARTFAVQQMYAIHRIELHLKDSLEFEVLRMLLRDDVYTFLHVLTATIGTQTGGTTTMAAPRTSIAQIIEILSIGCLVNAAVLRGGKDFDYKKWSEEPEIEKLIASIPKHLMPFFMMIPMLLDGVYATSLMKHASHAELEALAKDEHTTSAAAYEWRAKCLEEAIDFLKTSRSLMVQKGVRD